MSTSADLQNLKNGEASQVHVFPNKEVDPCSPEPYFRVTCWYDGKEGRTWRSIVFHRSDPRLQHYLDAVEELKRDMGVYVKDEPCL